MKQKLLTETPEEKRERLDKRNLSVKKRRAKETSTQRQKRLQGLKQDYLNRKLKDK